MLTDSVRKRLGRQVDRLALYAINRRIPQDASERFACPVTLQDVLAQTHVQASSAPGYQIAAPGEHTIHLQTRLGEINCRVTVRPAADAHAPLFIYHHGLAEYPYTSTWQRMIPRERPFPTHTVAVQAPYHSNVSDPIRVGFASTEHIYQMLAGSLRVIDYVQQQFEQHGASFTVVGGLSWGGITSLLYEGLFGSARAITPLFASPKLSQAIWDASQMFDRDLPVSRQELDELFDFTPIMNHVEHERIFPVMGEHDLFFRYENHAPLYDQRALVTLPLAHVGAMRFRNTALREHVLKTIDWAAQNPR